MPHPISYPESLYQRIYGKFSHTVEEINETENKPLIDGESLLEITPSNINLGALKYEEWKNDNSIVIRFFEGCGLP
ncbi:unnamed protein product, partial [marine sediment metagenome]